MYVGGRAEPFVFLTKIILLLVVVVRVCYYVLYIGGRAFSVSHQDDPCVGGRSACATVQCISGAEPLMYLTLIIQGLVVSVCVLLCRVYRGQSLWCI